MLKGTTILEGHKWISILFSILAAGLDFFAGITGEDYPLSLADRYKR